MSVARSPRLGLVAAALLALVGVALVGLGAQRRPAAISPEATRFVTPPRVGIDARNSPAAAADPQRPEVLAVANRIDTPDISCSVARSSDGGRRWKALERFARRTVGLSGADIAAALNEAATLAARRRLSAIGSKELSEAVDRVLAGPERISRILGPEEKLRVAYHEAGHAIVGWVLDASRTVDKVSIVARGHSLGSTWSLPTDDRRLRTRSQMDEEITAALAGRAAEEVVFSDLSNGSQLDLNRASLLARHMVYDLGMSESLGPIVLGSGDRAAMFREHSEALAQEADREVRRVLDDADQRARAVLIAHRGHLDRLAEMLVLRETMERQDLEAVLGDLPPGASAERGPAGPDRPTGPDRPAAPVRAR